MNLLNGIDVNALFAGLSADDRIKLLLAINSNNARSNNRATTRKGTIKEGSVHDLWNKCEPQGKALIVRQFIEDNARDHKIINRFTVPFLNAIKPARISFVEWLALNQGKLPVDDATLINAIADYESKIESFNESRLYNIVRLYNKSARGTFSTESAL